MAKKAKAVLLDLTKVKDGGGKFRTSRQTAGDYPATITEVETVKVKGTQNDQWLYTIKAGSGIYPLYCQHTEATLWKIRNLFGAAGITLPKKRVQVDPTLVVGKKIAVTLEDDEYDGKAKSVISATFPLSELDATDADDDEGPDDDAPKAKKKKKSKPVKADDDDDDEPTPKKKGKKGKKNKDLEEIDIEGV